MINTIFFKRLLVLAFVGASSLSTVHLYTVTYIPREVLFGNPTKALPRVSPNGKKIAYLAPHENVLNIWIRTIGQDDDHVVTHDTYRGIRWYMWSPDSNALLYIQDKDGDENWCIYRIDIATQAVINLTPFEGVQAHLIALSKSGTDALLELNKDDPRLHDLYHLDMSKGELTLVEKNPGTVTEWLIDTHMHVKGIVTAREDGGIEVLIRQSPDAEFKKLLEWGFEDGRSSGVLGFTRDDKELYILDSSATNTSCLAKIDCATEHFTMLYHDEGYDIGSVMINPKTRELEAVVIAKAHNEFVIFDQQVKQDLEFLAQVDGGECVIISRDDEDMLWIVAFFKDNGPVTCYAFDRKHKSVVFLFDSRPALKEYTLAAMEPFSLVARDGLKLEGYVTYPVDAERHDLPMVLNVHGGPWSRDTWGCDPEAQWFANRGYMCVQVNFRGSTGYGKAFLNAANKEWGNKMHHDLIDTVKYFIDGGIADSKRIAIYGGSYGGYAALCGAAFTPDVFCCAIDIVGPSNLLTLIQSIPPYWFHELTMIYQRIGNPETEEDFLKTCSPLFSVDKIKIPLLIVQGAQDPRVKQTEAEQIVAALKEKSIDHEYLLFPDEGHGFAKPENRLKFYECVERFLANNLGSTLTVHT